MRENDIEEVINKLNSGANLGNNNQFMVNYVNYIFGLHIKYSSFTERKHY